MNISETKDKSLKFSLVILTIEQNRISIVIWGIYLKKLTISQQSLCISKLWTIKFLQNGQKYQRKHRTNVKDQLQYK